MTDQQTHPQSGTLSARVANSPLFRWLLGRDDPERRPTDPVDVLYRSFHITSKCRYNASIRLSRVGSFSFLTGTVLSLGMILIPTLQVAEFPLAYPQRIVGSLQVFIAVAVLVYSVINATAHYETRAQSLNESGDRIKELSRNLRTARADAEAHGKVLDLAPFNQMYTSVSTISENHSRADYTFAKLQATEWYHITGLPRLWLNLVVIVEHAFSYLLPTALMIAEALLITDMLGITHIMTGVFAVQ